MTTLALSFQETHFDVVDRNNQPWLRLHQIGAALGYSRPDAVNKIFQANAGEFTDSMTALVELDTSGGKQQVRIFSLRGCHLLAMFSRTAIAKEFRKWVLDVLDQHTQPTTTTPKITHATKDQRAPLVSAVRRLVKTASAKGQPMTYSEAHSIINLKMGVAHIEELLPEQIPQAMTLVGGLMERIVMKEKLKLPKPDGAAWISAEQYAHLRQLTFEASLPFHLRKEFKKSIWTMLKSAFAVDSVKKLSVSQFDPAVSLIQKMEIKARKLSDRVTRVEREFFESVASRRFQDSDHDDLVDRLLKDL